MRRFVGTFGVARSAGPSSEGGRILGSRNHIIDGIPESIGHVHSRGKAIAWSVYMFSWTHITSVNFDPTEPLQSHKRLLNAIHLHCSQRGDTSYIVGDLSLVMAGHRHGTQTYSPGNLADHFEAVCHDHCEVTQHDFTFRRLARATHPDRGLSRESTVAAPPSTPVLWRTFADK